MASDLSVVLPLVGGFWFVLRSQLLFLVSLQLGQAITVLLSAFIACLVTLASRVVIIGFVAVGWGAPVQNFAHAIWPVPFAGTDLGAFLAAVVLAELSSRAIKSDRINTWVINNFADEMVKLLYGSMLQLKPVSVTLDTRKVYIGFVQGVPSLNPNKAFVRLLPVVSGYREQDDLTFRPTTYYADALRAAEEAGSISDFVIVIPLTTVKTANLFSRSMHLRFFAAKPKGLIESA